MKGNKLIFFNTGVLYVKLILVSAIGLIASRLILEALGASDYGLYSVVGGIVSFINIIGVTMVSVSYRYMAVEMGKGESGNPNKIYNTLLFAHILLALFLIIVGETLGLFYVNNYLNVEPGKIGDARFILHISLLTTAISLVTVPANGLIIACEKFIYTSLTEIVVNVVKLILVILMCYYMGNRLRLFALIMLLVTVLTSLSYLVYCRLKYPSVIRYRFNSEKKDYKSIAGFTGWSVFGAVAVVGAHQGAALVINFFFGTVLNATYGLATQVNRYVQVMTTSLNQASVPQIMKSYGAGNEGRSLNIVYTISRYSTLIFSIIAIPIMLSVDELLGIWLVDVPEYTNLFVIFMLINAMVGIMFSGFDPCIQSTGKIKENEIGYGLITISILPIMFVLYKLGCPPYINVIVLPFLTLATRLFQIYILKKQTEFDLRFFLKRSLLPSMITLMVAFVPLFFLKFIWGHSVAATICFVLIGALWAVISIWIVGLKPSEKNNIVSFVLKKIKK